MSDEPRPPRLDDETPVGSLGLDLIEESFDADPTGDRVRAAAANRRRSQVRAVWEWVVVVAVAITAALLIRLFLFQQYYIDGPSMQTTLMPRDRVLVNKLSYRLHDVNRGDVVVFDRITSAEQHDDLIKRVIALPGETLEVRSCDIYIDGVLLSEPYLDPALLAAPDPVTRCGSHADMSPVTVPEEMVFVMGDNRVQSFDSRDFGAIDIDKIRGRAFVVIWPASAWAWL
ncbi:MAG: signal peptidase I [Ilumatobacteraceae bacterium]